jgi:16S rRNA (guanine1207-N2)-methyltransferase
MINSPPGPSRHGLVESSPEAVPVPEHYFSADPQTAERRRKITIMLWGRPVELSTAAGVFSPDGLDRGTAVLLRESPIPTGSPTLLDLGCGYGPIALALALHCPGARVDAVDVNERALELCRENAVALRVADRVEVCLPEQVDPTRSYDEIWSNPPIRIGKQALHELLLTWLPRLKPGGTARLVVGRNLGADTLQAWLIGQGYECVRTGAAKGFRVLAVKPRN